MNHLRSDIDKYAAAVRKGLTDADTAQLELFVLPPFTGLVIAQEAFRGTGVAIGGQNMHWADRGAYTGEISASMLRDVGCSYVALGHAERFQYFGESYEAIGLKVTAALKNGLTPILCLGEGVEDKEEGRAGEVLADQLSTALRMARPDELKRIILAYEPRWAIGQRAAANPAYVLERHRELRSSIEKRFGSAAAQATRIIYGGSVDCSNAGKLIALPEVDGLFVGRYAWSGEGFVEIVRIVAAHHSKGTMP